MPATEETYRNQSTLHIVFGISSIAMLLAIVWMIMADHLRPWKEVQREFHHVEEAKLSAARQKAEQDQRAKYQTQIDALDAKIKQTEENAEQRASDIRKIDKEISALGGVFEGLDTQKKFTKAELDSQRSLYDGMIDRSEERGAKNYLQGTIVATERRLHDLTVAYQEADTKLKEAKKRKVDIIGNVEKDLKDKEKLTREFDTFDRTLKQKEAEYFGVRAWLRGLPGVDIVPPTKIQQISLPDLTINYNFKEVPRYDRCTTCHQGIDRLGYEKDAEGKPMPSVFASHPHLTDGATSLDPKGKVVKAGLYLDPNGPHPINSFGCTICHGGQGSGTDFTYSSHEPNDLHQKEEWEKKENWREIHHWDEPMLPARFQEASCLKCHHEVADVPQAVKLQAGYERIVTFGCTGCHTIGGEGSFGPDLTDERQVGPNLQHIGSKVSKDWTLKWIKNPHAFRPDSRMPRFYGVTNNDAPKDLPKSHAEIHAITHYLFAKSTPPAAFVEPAGKGDPTKGKELFLQKGCLACHQHRPYEKADVQVTDKTHVNSKYKPDKAATFDPSIFPETVRKYAKADYGPNLANISAKFQSHDQGHKWLANWVKAPETYHPKSLMPNLQLSMEDATDISAWILSIPGEWPVSVVVPAVDSKEVTEAIDELVKLYVTKAGFKLGDKSVTKPLSEVDEFVRKELTPDEKLMFLGEKTIARLGCFGCHNIPGYENAKPIGTQLNGWGIKSPAKLDYGHIAEYLIDQPVDDAKNRDGTDPYYQEKLAEHTRSGFLYQKLHRPRSYDFKKTNEDLKSWDERLRMPQFAWANNPKAVEEVMTFVLGLTGEKISGKYLAKVRYRPEQHALSHGSKVLNRYNCTGCHVLEMPKYTVKDGTGLAEAIPDLRANLRASYTNRGTDFLKEFYPGMAYDSKLALNPDKIEGALALKPEVAGELTIEGMPIGTFENELTVQLWKPAIIRGYTFNVGDTITLDQTKVSMTPAEGGNFAWLYATYQAEKTGGEFTAIWNRLPPPLVREGNKVQTPWLTAFLKDPYPVRPAVNLRMPRFHFKTADDSAADETSALGNYFAAKEGAGFPYQSIPERSQDYLADREAKHKNYFGAGWTMMSAKTSPCLSCHAIGPYKPTGGAQVVNGPDLKQVAQRFRPAYLAEWLAKPSRLVPFTAMPQNIAAHGAVQIPVPATFEDQPFEMVKAIRDTLLNYVNAVEQQLAAGKVETPPAAPAMKAGGGSE